MDKICLFENGKFKIRYVLRNEEPWFIGKDIATALSFDNPTNTIRDYVSDEDKTLIHYINKVGREDEIIGINLYAVGHLISCSSMRTNNSENLKALKDTVYNGILSGIRRAKENAVELSEEDTAALKILHASSNIERMTAVSEFKNVVLKNYVADSKREFSSRHIKSKDNVHSISDVTDALGLKKGQITMWANGKGYFRYGGKSGKSPQVAESASKFFRIYNEGTTIGKIGLTDEGVSLVEKYISEISSIKRERKRRGDLNA